MSVNEAPLIYMVAKSEKVFRRDERIGTYAIVTERDSNVFEHWGCGIEGHTAVMAAHAMIRILGELASIDDPPRLRIATNYLNVLTCRIASTIDDAAKREKGIRVKEKNRESVWLEYAKLSRLLAPSYGWYAYDLDESLVRRATKLARWALRKGRLLEDKSTPGVRLTDNAPLDWLTRI